MEKQITDIFIPVSPGELLDKLTILQIKAENIQDPNQQKNVIAEQTALAKIANTHIPQTEIVKGLVDMLYAINKELWQIEDDIRVCEKQKKFQEPFIELARAVYKTNDERANIKKQINQTLGSKWSEEKFYEPY